MIAYAQATAIAQSFLDRLNQAILFPLITLMLTVALVVFLYGCFIYIVNAADPGARQTGQKHIMWGLIGMLIMISAYAILTIAAGTFGIDVPG